MFIGHFAAGLGAKAAAPRTSLGTLFLAAQFADLLWPTLLLLGVERVAVAPGITAANPLDFVHYPVSHSLLAVCGWGLLLGGLYWALRRDTRGALVVGALVVSHWALDLVVHRPDLPLVPGGPRVGIGLWHSVAGTLAVEAVLLVLGLALYLRATAARDRAGRYGLWALVGLLVLIQVSNLASPPPPDATAIAWVGQAQWLLVAWAYWVDRHRSTVPSRARPPSSVRRAKGPAVA